MLPSPNHEPHNQLFIGPGAPHSPPYDTEIADGLASAGIIAKNVFTPNEFDLDLGTFMGEIVWTAFMIVPIPPMPRSV